MPDWARRWQRVQFDNGWLLPGNPPEFGGRNATLIQQAVHLEELSKRRIYHSFNPQGLGIIAASILSFGTEEQKQQWAARILRAEITAALGMSEPGAGSDLAGLRTRAVLDGDHFVVNGQKVWTSGAHHADVLLTFVRTDPDAPKHKGISVLLIPTDTPGVVRRPFASIADRDDRDFNEVFFEDVRVPAENLIGELNKAGPLPTARSARAHSSVAQLRGSIGRSRRRFRAAHGHRSRPVRNAGDGLQALRLLGSAALARESRGEQDVASLSVLKLLGSEAIQRSVEHALDAEGAEARASCVDLCVHAVEPRQLRSELVRTLCPQFCRHHRGRYIGDPTEHRRPASARATTRLRSATCTFSTR